MRHLGQIPSCAVILALVALTSSAQHFPPLDQENPAKTRTVKDLSFCMTSRNSIPVNSSSPLFTFDFASPGASGVVLIDGKTATTFRDERHLEVHAAVSAGNHMFQLRLDKPATNTSMSSRDDFKYLGDQVKSGQ